MCLWCTGRTEHQSWIRTPGGFDVASWFAFFTALNPDAIRTQSPSSCASSLRLVPCCCVLTVSCTLPLHPDTIRCSELWSWWPMITHGLFPYRLIQLSSVLMPDLSPPESGLLSSGHVPPGYLCSVVLCQDLTILIHHLQMRDDFFHILLKIWWLH